MTFDMDGFKQHMKNTTNALKSSLLKEWLCHRRGTRRKIKVIP
jgi:hypothetical protein